MQTQLTGNLLSPTDLAEADRILRACVHCGFCTATCPTYQLLGDELDGPRGRIYLIKQMLEGQSITEDTRLHLDRCLSCRSCETTCPSGVEYSKLLNLGRAAMEQALPRPMNQRLLRQGMKSLLPYPKRLELLLKTAGLFKPLLPAQLSRKLPPASPIQSTPAIRHQRKIILFEGCVQSVAARQINSATRRLLDRLGISCISGPRGNCCGAVNHHLDDQRKAKIFARKNIDEWMRLLDGGAENILFTASACALEVHEYEHLLREDTEYAPSAGRISQASMDIGSFLVTEISGKLQADSDSPRIAFHAPCTLQHGLGNKAGVQNLLRQMGFALHEPSEAHLCCGSAGTYSITQPQLSTQLRESKLSALSEQEADVIATANIGCMLHLAEKASMPVRHWVEIVEEFGERSESCRSDALAATKGDSPL